MRKILKLKNSLPHIGSIMDYVRTYKRRFVRWRRSLGILFAWVTRARVSCWRSLNLNISHMSCFPSIKRSKLNAIRMQRFRTIDFDSLYSGNFNKYRLNFGFISELFPNEPNQANNNETGNTAEFFLNCFWRKGIG